MRRNAWMLTVTVVLIVGTFVATIFSDNRPELGLDLQGGVSVVLFPVEGSDLSTLDTATEIIANRVNALGVSEPEVNRQGDTIVIDLPGAKNREDALELVGRTAELRFRPYMGFFPEEPADTTTTTAAGGSTTTAAGGSTTTGAGVTTTAAGSTAPVDPTASTAPADPAATTVAPPAETTIQPPVTTAPRGAGEERTVATQNVSAVRPEQEATTTSAGATTTTSAGATTTTVAGATTTTVAGATTTTAGVVTCADLVTPREEDVAGATVVLPTKPGEPKETAGCYQLGPTVLTGKTIRSAKAGYDSASGWLVRVKFRGDEFVEKVAGPYVGQQVAIVLDGIVYSAPTINAGITGRDVQITGSFSEKEAKELALVLRYGALPVQFDKEQETVQSISPTLGKDQLRAGILAGLVGLALVALYMILLYRVLGLIVWFGLGLTALLFFTLVSFLSAQVGLSMTLAGITGLIVSVGVTVDSYVVYFERLKDEVRTGKTVRSSVDVGFKRAFRTIVAADLVSLLGAAVLYMLATGSVRGFAFFLGVSTAIDLLIAYFFMHPLVSMLARRPALVRMRGVGIAAGLDVPEARA